MARDKGHGSGKNPRPERVVTLACYIATRARHVGALWLSTCQPATTSSLIAACTSGCRRTSASNEPVDLIALESSILRRSNWGPPAALTASATSPWVTAPKRRPDFPALATTLTDLASS